MKYDLICQNDSVYNYIQRLTNQLWKLIPMRENEEPWEKQLNTVLLEIVGLNNIIINPQFLQLICKLEGLKNYDVDFNCYRKTVFECINLLQGLKNELY